MRKTQAKIESMSTAEWHQYHQLLESQRLMDYFADEILRFAHSPLKPDDVLRRFSLNGDGRLDLKEFQLAVRRLGIIQPTTVALDHQRNSFTTDTTTDTVAALQKTKELFSVFCPSNTKKLDIDMFCRIMNEWSLQLLRAQQRQQPAQASGYADRHAMATIATPYAIENGLHSSSDRANSQRVVVHSDGEMIWRRIRNAVLQHLDKLRQIYFKMDIASTGTVSQDEFALALSHIGVFLTATEYEKLYDALPSELKMFAANDAAFAIRYADFLAIIQHNHPEANKHALQTSAQTSSPPIATNARLWDLLVAVLPKLEPLIQQFERARQRYVTADTFRDMLLRCGLALSNPDYAALRVRLRSFTDSNGSLGLSALLHALKSHDRTAMATSVRASTIAGAPTAARLTTIGPNGVSTVSPIRTGRKTVFTTVSEPLNSPASYANSSSTSTSVATHAAGKSNEQRNLEANRSVVKIRDERRWKSDINFHCYESDKAPAAIQRHPSDQNETDAHTSSAVVPLALERRILAKLQQLKDTGQLGSSSPQTVFPGDRFGRITRGQFRQSLVHLGVLARYAEVESLFWMLDPNGRGYMVALDLYDHLNTTATKLPSSSHNGDASWSLPLLSSNGSADERTRSPTHISTESEGRLPRSVQKILEGMLLQHASLVQLCERCDVQRTGVITRGELTAAIQELGVLASPQDVQTAITALTQRVEAMPSPDSSVVAPAEPYHPIGIVYSKLEARLKQLCSDLLSPKKRRQHLSTASVLLAPQETQPFASITDAASNSDFNMNVANETDALWNCPRRKQNHDHRAMKTTIQISDQLYAESPRDLSVIRSGDSPTGESSLEKPQHRQLHRGRRLAVIAILQDLLERRGDLKSVIDLHRNADIHGQVTKRDLVEILMASRLSLPFSNAVPAGITAKDFVDVLYPSTTEPLTVSFLDLLHRISDLLNEFTRVTPVSAKTCTGLYSNNANPRDVTRRLHTATTSGPVSAGVGAPRGMPNLGVAYSPIQLNPLDGPTSRNAPTTARSLSLFASDELSLQRKVLYESRLRDLLTSEKGRQSAAVLIRHAFKGVMARELVVPIDNGEFEAVCRASDLKYVCYRLGLDLDVGELHFVVSCLDRHSSGYIASPQLLQFFVDLAMRATGQTTSGAHAAAVAASPCEERAGLY